MMSIWPGGNLSPLAKRELLYSTLSFGLSIWLLGITFIDRLNPEKSHKTIDSLAENIVQNKVKKFKSIYFGFISRDVSVTMKKANILKM
jgi:1-acyl-sn-glycerol-3-phosphate acyltransferase